MSSCGNPYWVHGVRTAAMSSRASSARPAPTSVSASSRRLQGRQRPGGRVDSGQQRPGMSAGLFAVVAGMASRQQPDSGGRVQLGGDGGDVIVVVRNAVHGP